MRKRKVRLHRTSTTPKPAMPAAAVPVHWLIRFEQEREALEDARAQSEPEPRRTS